MKPATAKSKGRATEVALVNWLRSWGLKVERRRLTGTKDQGDIAGWNTDNGSVVVEVKSAGGGYRIADWISQLDDETDHAAADFGFVACRPKGKPHPDDWIVVLRLPWLMDVLRQAKWVPADPGLANLAAAVARWRAEKLTSPVLDAALADLRARAVESKARAEMFAPKGVEVPGVISYRSDESHPGTAIG